jgi:branched-subunit amino acid ABC-type transport system permease component
MVFSQLLANGIIAGAIYALMAASFSLIYNIVKFMDLSPGAIFVVGAFFAYAFNMKAGIGIIPSIFLALLICGLCGILINHAIYRPLRKKGADNFTLLLSSFGVFLVITGMILLFFGADLVTFRLPVKKGIEFLGIIITPMQIILVLSSLIMFILLWVLMKHTKIGQAMRAVSDDQTVSSTLGIDVEKITAITFFISATLAGVAGILVSFEQNLEHSMGFGAILKGITAAIVGGIGNVPAALLGGFLIGIVENIAILYLPSGLKDAIAFMMLVLFLLFRPHGIIGSKTREESAG